MVSRIPNSTIRCSVAANSSISSKQRCEDNNECAEGLWVSLYVLRASYHIAENMRVCYRCAGAQQMSMSPLLHWITLALQELTNLSVSTERCFVVSTLIAGPSMVLCFVGNCLR